MEIATLARGQCDFGQRPSWIDPLDQSLDCGRAISVAFDLQVMRPYIYFCLTTSTLYEPRGIEGQCSVDRLTILDAAVKHVYLSQEVHDKLGSRMVEYFC